MRSSTRPGGIPGHLPERLAICYYGWDWITSALPNEPYGDLDRALRETRERGFNCIRPDMGLGLLCDRRGNRRGPIEFTDWIPGASANLQCVNGRGGGCHDVWERVMLLFELAEKHDLYVIGTSWIYQDFVAQVADARLRREIIAVPVDERLGYLAEEWERLLTALEQRGLAHRLALAELVNEVDYTPVAVAGEGGSAPSAYDDWVEAKGGPVDAGTARRLGEAALAFLRERHPEVLLTVDVAGAGNLTGMLPENAQVADHHVYCSGVTQALCGAAGMYSWTPEKGPDPDANPLLRSVLRPDLIPWDEFIRRASRVRTAWRSTGWLYHHLDNERYDAWCVEHFEECRPGIAESIERGFRAGTEVARERSLPLVVDEGYIFYPPLGSRFVATPEGRWSEEYAVALAVKAGYWGILPTGYFRPNTPVWHDEGQCAWIAGLNQRILGGG